MLPDPSAKSLHLCFPPLRLPAQCLLLAHVPSEDSEWSRDGSCPDFSQGISLFVQILLSLHCRAPNSELVSPERCAGPLGGDIAQLCLGAALGQSCVLSSCVTAMSGCSQRSAKEVPWASVLRLEAGAGFSLKLLRVGNARWEHQHSSGMSHSLGLAQQPAEGRAASSGFCCLLIKGQWLCSPASVCTPIGVQMQPTDSLQLLVELSLLGRAQP